MGAPISDWADFEWSELTELLVTIVEATRACHLSNKSRAFFEERVQDYDLDEGCPSWIVELLTSIIERKYTEELRFLGASTHDFMCVLSELEEKYLDHYNNYGEGVTWEFPHNDVSVFICFESRKSFYCVRPIDPAMMNQWLKEQYRKIRVEENTRQG